jgi:2-oxoisovalerate dehydrogenase E2 component (dihydrolipoyl transacylase)
VSVQVIKVPDIGEGIAQVELVAWHVKPGDAVAEDQALADVMTDKATVEIPSPVAGQVVGLGGEVGQVLAVGAELIRIERDGAGAQTALPLGPAEAALPAGPPRDAAAAVAPSASAAVSAPMAAMSQAVAGASALAEEAPHLANPAPAAIAAIAQAAATAAATLGRALESAQPASSGRPIASPAVRARAWELGVDLKSVPGSGPGGRIVKADVDAYAARTSKPVAPAARISEPVAPAARISEPVAPAARTSEPVAPAAPAAARPVAEVEVVPAAARAMVNLEAAHPPATREVKILGLRRVIAQRMQESKRRIPHYTYVEEVDVTELEGLRLQLNAKWSGQRGHLTLLPFLIQAIVQAVREYPQVNARFDDEAGVLTEFDAVHMGIATQTDAGLMVPVMRDAQARDLWSYASEITRLADAARSGRIAREELSGSTITVTSLGPLGGIVSTPVINYPEVAIVGVNRIVTRPVIISGTVAARQLMNLSSSFDHRIVDGAQAAGFVQFLRGMLERPATMFIR